MVPLLLLALVAPAFLLETTDALASFQETIPETLESLPETELDISDDTSETWDPEDMGDSDNSYEEIRDVFSMKETPEPRHLTLEEMWHERWLKARPPKVNTLVTACFHTLSFRTAQEPHQPYQQFGSLHPHRSLHLPQLPREPPQPGPQ